MVTTVVIGMLCVHLLCFSLMFLLISRRLHGKKMGMDVFALGNLMLGLAYVLQLFGGHANESVMSIVNHTLTLCAPVTYVLGGLRFFDYPIRIWRPLLATAVGYTAVQILVQVLLGTEARHALLAGYARRSSWRWRLPCSMSERPWPGTCASRWAFLPC